MPYPWIVRIFYAARCFSLRTVYLPCPGPYNTTLFATPKRIDVNFSQLLLICYLSLQTLPILVDYLHAPFFDIEIPGYFLIYQPQPHIVRSHDPISHILHNLTIHVQTCWYLLYIKTDTKTRNPEFAIVQTFYQTGASDLLHALHDIFVAIQNFWCTTWWFIIKIR